MTQDTFRIAPRGAFSWSQAFSVLTRFRPLAHVWRGTEDDVELSLLSDDDFTPVRVQLRFDGVLSGRVSHATKTAVIERQVARIFSLDHDGEGWGELAIARLVPGLRPVCFSSPYEAACWGIVSQRISKDQAARVFASLVAEHGHFPTPAELAGVERVKGLPAIKVERLRGVAAAALEGRLGAERLRALGDEGAPASLRRIAGIGPFWSAGVYLRACGIRDVFPDEPLALAALARFHGLGRSPSAKAVEEIVETFRPFRMWACFALRVADAITPSA